MDLPHVVILQKNHLYLKERLQVDPVLDALYQESIFTQTDYDRCRQAGTEKCEMVLETLKKKGVEGYKTLCAVLDTTQHFIKERLDKTSTEEGSPDLVVVNKGKLEAQHKRELAKKDGEIDDLKSEIEGLQKRIEQNNNYHAELEDRMKKESAEHISEIEQKNQEIETLKTTLSKSKDELQELHAKCDELEKKLQEEQEAYDALVDVPRSQCPESVNNGEQDHHAGSTEKVCQFSIEPCCDESQLRLLPCLHSACKPCLDHQATQTAENYIHCPSCGREFTVDQTTVDHVRRNEAAYTASADGEMKCSYIDEDHDAKAVMYCHECDDKLCSDCRKHHDTPKRNRHHTVTVINQAEKIPVKEWLKEANCRNRDHSGNKLQLYDHTCKRAICRVCELGAHKDHKNEDLNLAYDVAKGQLEEQVKSQQDKLKDVTTSMKNVKSHQIELGTTQRRLGQVATQVCKTVAVNFLRRQRLLLKQIQMSLQAPNEMVQEKLDTLHDVHASIVSAIDYTQRTVESTRREELITLTEVLKTKCDENLKWKLPEDDTRDARILLTFQGQKALMELIDTFGGLASSLNVDDIPDKQPTLQDLQKWNMQLALKEEDTRKVHEGRWRQLGEIIHRITGTVPCTSESQRLRPEQLTSQEDEPGQPTSQEAESGTLTSHDVFEAAKHFILGAFVPLESPGGGLCLKGPKLQLDGDVANPDYCHVTPGGELVNSPPATQHTDSGRLQTLCGTCSSTPIPLPPSPSSVNLVSPTTRYWEAHTRVGVLGGGWLPVLEVGVGEESQVDRELSVCLQRRSWCVRVVRCGRHRGSLCTMIYMAGERGKCYGSPMSNTPGTQAILHYGVVLDVGRGRIGFIDIDRSVVLEKVDVEFRENLLPVFTVCPLSVDYTVNMKVVSGEEILMSDIKKSLINEVLA